MTGTSLKLQQYSNMFLTMIIYVALNELAVAFPLSKHAEVRSLEKVSTQSDSQAVRLHPGVIASVVIVTVAAIAAAVFIIRKYCCTRSNATYRYSELRQNAEENAAREDDDSDEDLLE